MTETLNNHRVAWVRSAWHLLGSVGIWGGALAGVGCGARTAEEVGGKTSWLSSCEHDSDCSRLDEAKCVQNLCTVECESNGCGSIEGTRCAPKQEGCFEDAACLPRCTEPADCRTFGEDYGCISGACVLDSCVTPDGAVGEQTRATGESSGVTSAPEASSASEGESSGSSKDTGGDTANDDVCDPPLSPQLERAFRAQWLGDETSVLGPDVFGTITHLILDGDSLGEDIESIEGIQCFTALEYLTLNRAELTDWEPLSQVPLGALSITASSAPDFEVLSQEGSLLRDTLYRLDVRGSEVRELAGLSEFGTMTELVLVDNNIEDLSSLGQPPQLRTLEVAGNQIRTLAPLNGLDQLTSLDASRNRVESISELELPALGSLQVGSNAITAIGSTAGFPQLSLLALDGNDLGGLEGIESLTAMSMLYINDTPIVDLAPLSHLSELYLLRLDNTRVESLAPLSSLAILANLNLTNTPVADLAPLLDIAEVGATSCRRLEVQTANLSAQSIDDVLPALCNSGWQVNVDGDGLCSNPTCNRAL